MMTLGQFLAWNYPEPELIMEPWLPTEGILLLYGRRGGGKTNVNLLIALHIAAGQNMLHMRVERPHKVLYVDAEMNPASVRQRIQKFLGGMPELRAARDNLFYMSQAEFECGIPDLSEPGEGRELIEDALAQTGAYILFLDNKSSLFRKGEENAAEGWSGPNEWLLGLRRKHITTVIVHHAGKEGPDGEIKQRGSSRIEDVVDGIIQLRCPKGSRAHDGYVPIRWWYEKARSFTPDQDTFDFTVYFEDERGRATLCAGDLSKEEPAWCEEARRMRKEGLSYDTIAERLGQPKTTVHRYVKRTLGDMAGPASLE